MTYAAMLARVQHEWADHPVCVFRMGKEFAVAQPGTPDCVEIELTKGAEMLGTYKKPYRGAKASVMVGRDL